MEVEERTAGPPAELATPYEPEAEEPEQEGLPADRALPFCEPEAEEPEQVRLFGRLFWVCKLRSARSEAGIHHSGVQSHRTRRQRYNSRGT